MLVIELSSPEILKELNQFCEPGQVLLDLVDLGDCSRIRAKCQGLDGSNPRA